MFYDKQLLYTKSFFEPKTKSVPDGLEKKKIAVHLIRERFFADERSQMTRKNPQRQKKPKQCEQ